MTIQLDWVDDLSYPAGPGFRLLLGSMFSDAGVLHPQTDFQVTATPTASMNVDVSTGTAYILDSLANYGTGFFLCYSNAAIEVAIPAADTNPRIDLICLVVNAAGESGTSPSSATIQDIVGTPSATPSPPAAPSDSLVLAQVAVGANVTSIAQSNITQETGAAKLHSTLGARAIGTLVATSGVTIASGTGTIMTYNLVSTLLGGMGTQGNYTALVVPRTGVYTISAQTGWQNGNAGVSAGGLYATSIFRNGSAMSPDLNTAYYGVTGDQVGDVIPSYSVDLNANDAIAAQVYQNSGSNQGAGATPYYQTYLCVREEFAL